MIPDLYRHRSVNCSEGLSASVRYRNRWSSNRSCVSPQPRLGLTRLRLGDGGDVNNLPGEVWPWLSNTFVGHSDIILIPRFKVPGFS